MEMLLVVVAVVGVGIVLAKRRQLSFGQAIGVLIAALVFDLIVSATLFSSEIFGRETTSTAHISALIVTTIIVAFMAFIARSSGSKAQFAQSVAENDTDRLPRGDEFGDPTYTKTTRKR